MSKKSKSDRFRPTVLHEHAASRLVKTYELLPPLNQFYLKIKIFTFSRRNRGQPTYFAFVTASANIFLHIVLKCRELWDGSCLN